MRPVCPTCRRPHDEWTHHLVISEASLRLQIDTHKIADAALRLHINDLKESCKRELEQLSYAIDLLDECVDFLHTDSELNKRIGIFLDGTICPVAHDAQLTNGDNNP